MKRVLITGVNGFVGKHLARAFLAANYQVDGLTANEPLAKQLTGVVTNVFQCDLADRSAVSKLELSGYDVIVNLAGLANVGKSFDQPELYLRINVDVLRFIGKRALDQNPNIRLIAISSGAVYDSDQPMPLTENSAVSADTSPYAASKLAMEQAANKLQVDGLDCIVVRPFNHFGLGQESGFILPDLYDGLVRAVSKNEPLSVGNLTTKRDYTDVRDIVQAYVLLADAPKSTLTKKLYNVCSGTPLSGKDILEALRRQIPKTSAVEILEDKTRFRKNDPQELVGSNERLVADTGWQPKIELTKTIRDFVTERSA